MLDFNDSHKHDKHVEPPYLFYAAYYGNIASMRYFFSERPIKALERYAQKYSNMSKDLIRDSPLIGFVDHMKF